MTASSRTRAQAPPQRIAKSDSKGGASQANGNGRMRRNQGALEAACRTLFAEHGYVDTRVTDIALLAGVSPGTFYARFGTKAAAYEQTMREPVPKPDGDARSHVQASTRRGRRTRAQLLEAARQVFEELDFMSARIVDITSRAGSATGSFYTHFESKEEIFREVMLGVIEELYAASEPHWDQPAENPVDRIRDTVRLWVESYEQHARMFMLLDEAAAIDGDFAVMRRDIRHRFVSRIASGLRLLQDDGLANPDLDTDTAASALTAMVGHFTHVWLGLGEPYDTEAAIETLTYLWAHGIGLRTAETDWSNGRASSDKAGARQRADC